MVGATLESMGVGVCSSKQARKDKLVDSSVKLSDYDLYLRSLNHRAEVKSSTMWGEGKNFTIQQIRNRFMMSFSFSLSFRMRSNFTSVLRKLRLRI